MISSFDDNGVQFAWNASSIKLAEECLRKYQYIMIEGWTSPKRNVHLRFGGHFATALEHYYKLRAEGMESNEALIEVVWEALRDTWDRTCPTCHGRGQIRMSDEAAAAAFPAVGKVEWATEDCSTCEGTGQLHEGGTPWDSGDTAKNRENLIRTIIWYVDQFENEQIEVLHLSDGRPAVELSATLEVDDGIVFTAHLDRVVRYQHEPYVMDQKTTGGAVGPYFFSQFSPDTQMSMYTFLGKAIFSIPVKGIIIDAAEIKVGFTRFERGFTFRTDDQLEEWYDATMHHIERARHATRENHFPMTTTSCGNYGGCPFREVCSRPKGVRANFLAGAFEKGKVLQPLEQR